MSESELPSAKPNAETAQQRPQKFDYQLDELFDLLRGVDYDRLPEHIRTAARFLVARIEELEIRMDGNKNHGRSHVHIKYKKNGHAASYSIDDGSRLAGKLPAYYDKKVHRWITKYRTELQSLWDSTQVGNRSDGLLITFQKTVYD